MNRYKITVLNGLGHKKDIGTVVADMFIADHFLGKNVYTFRNRVKGLFGRHKEWEVVHLYKTEEKHVLIEKL